MAHSFRAEFITSAAESGAALLRIADQSRHKSLDVLRGYVRRADMFKDHARCPVGRSVGHRTDRGGGTPSRPVAASIDLYFQGTACWHKGVNPENLAQARGYFERALAPDSNSIEALAGEALVDVMIGGGLMSEDRVIRIAGAEAAANQVLSVAPNHAFAHYILGFVHVVTNRAAQGMAKCDHALALDRNLATAHAMIGLAKSILGRAEETEGHVGEALRLSPREITANSWMHLASGAKLILGRDQEAVTWLRRSIEANRNYPLAHFYLAAALVHLDRLEEARASVQTGLVLDPTFTIRRYRAWASSDNPTYLAQRERIDDGMRLAGVPEG